MPGRLPTVVQTEKFRKGMSIGPTPRPTRDRPDVLRDETDARVYVCDADGASVCAGIVRRIGLGVFEYIHPAGDSGRCPEEWQAFLALGFVLHADGEVETLHRVAHGRNARAARPVVRLGDPPPAGRRPAAAGAPRRDRRKKPPAAEPAPAPPPAEEANHAL